MLAQPTNANGHCIRIRYERIIWNVDLPASTVATDTLWIIHHGGSMISS